MTEHPGGQFDNFANTPPTFLTLELRSVGGIMVSIAAFQAVDPGSIPGRRNFFQSWKRWCVYFPHPGEHVPRGLTTRISGFHPGGPGSIPGNGKLLFGDSLKLIFWVIACCIGCWLGGLKEGKNIASAGNRTRINCLEGSYADHYTTDAVMYELRKNSKCFFWNILAFDMLSFL